MMFAPFVRSPYNYDMMAASDESGLKCEDISLTVQEPRDECDINTIVRQFGLTGHLPQDVRLPMSGDFTSITDFASALNAVNEASATFNSLPADMRSRFSNNPALFVDFCSDERNREELGKMGLLKPVESPPAPISVIVTNAVTEPAKVTIGSSPGTGSGGS